MDNVADRLAEKKSVWQEARARGWAVINKLSKEGLMTGEMIENPEYQAAMTAEQEAWMEFYMEEKGLKE